MIYSLAAMMLLAVPACFTACSNDDDNNNGRIYDALVTILPGGGNVAFVVNDTVAVKPSNITKPLCDHEVRALTRFYVPTTEGPLTNGQAVEVMALDTILTKPSTAWSEKVDRELGHDPINIEKDWFTVAEDGYLTLHFRVLSGSKKIPHSLHLLKGVNQENPYELEFRHTANGDTGSSYLGGYVAFDITDILPTGADKTVSITVRYRDLNGKDATLTLPCRGLSKRHLYMDDAKE